MQKLDDCQIAISESPDSTAEWCKTHRLDVLLMEVKKFSPWMFNEAVTTYEQFAAVMTANEQRREAERLLRQHWASLNGSQKKDSWYERRG